MSDNVVTGIGIPEISTPRRSHRLISMVPEHIYTEDNERTASRFKSSYNVASWLNLPNTETKVTLVLEVEDDKGKSTFDIDSATPNNHHRVLLSSLVDIEVRGKIRSMGIYLAGVDKGDVVKLEEVFLQKYSLDQGFGGNSNPSLTAAS